MLKKLMKHELKANSRVMLPFFGGILLLALMVRFSLLPSAESLIWENEGVLLSIAKIVLYSSFGLGVAALFIIPLLLCVVRFKKTVLQDEGYLTMTLPVSTHEIILSRLLCTIIWYAACALLFILIAFIFVSVLDEYDMEHLLDELRKALATFRELQREDRSILLRTLLLLAESLLLSIVGTAGSVLMCFAAFSMGYSGNKKKNLLSVLLIYGFTQVTGNLTGRLYWSLGERLDGLLTMGSFDSILRSWQILINVNLFPALLFAGGFYALTWYFITKKLNLE